MLLPVFDSLEKEEDDDHSIFSLIEGYGCLAC
jgi:hypothetical protein